MRSHPSRGALVLIFAAALAAAVPACQKQEAPPPESAVPAMDTPAPPTAETAPPSDMGADTTGAGSATGGGH